MRLDIVRALTQAHNQTVFHLGGRGALGYLPLRAGFFPLKLLISDSYTVLNYKLQSFLIDTNFDQNGSILMQCEI